MIEIPRQDKPRSGLFKRGKQWCAWYYVDGRTRQASLGTEDEDEALKARDAFYRSLADQGATVRSVRVKAAAGDAYIAERPRFTIRVPGRKIRYAATIEQAREIRDGLLSENVQRLAHADENLNHTEK